MAIKIERKHKHPCASGQEWEETKTHPTKGPKGDTLFLKDNYRFMSVGGIFRTPAARFSHAQINEGAKKAGFIVSITPEGSWHKVTVTGKLPSAPTKKKEPDSYLGAGKTYPPVETPDIFS